MDVFEQRFPRSCASPNEEFSMEEDVFEWATLWRLRARPFSDRGFFRRGSLRAERLSKGIVPSNEIAPRGQCPRQCKTLGQLPKNVGDRPDNVRRTLLNVQKTLRNVRRTLGERPEISWLLRAQRWRSGQRSFWRPPTTGARPDCGRRPYRHARKVRISLGLPRNPAGGLPEVAAEDSGGATSARRTRC